MEVQKRVVYCANCGERGHIYRECTGPITSFGIIAFKVVHSQQEESADLNENLKKIISEHKIPKEIDPTIPLPPLPLLNFYPQRNFLYKSNYPKIKFLLIQRKDTMGYIDVIRGKYPDEEPNRTESLKTYFGEMTGEERLSLITKDFDQIWDEVWNNRNSKIYKNEYSGAKEKFTKLMPQIHTFLNETHSLWKYTEFGIPKGRRCMKESNISCAEREFCEETGYSRDDYQFLSNYPTVYEEFLGTNGIRYRHIYYVVKMNDSISPPSVDSTSLVQTGEVKNVGWFTHEECQAILRPYDTEKKKVLSRVYRDILSMNFNFNCSQWYYKRR
jgi:8-oxo-dGTP pyrophosphatase MutT (NUDIX family)